MSIDELESLKKQIQAEINSRSMKYLIDDSNRNKSRDTISSFHKVLPQGIERDEEGKYYATTIGAVKWVEERLNLGWELIKQ